MTRLRMFLVFALASAACAAQSVPGSFAQDLRDYVALPAPYGYEDALAGLIAKELAAYAPTRDSLGDVIVRVPAANAASSPDDSAPLLLAASLSTAGYVVSGITPDGYLRLQTVPFPNPQPLFNELRNAQPVRVETTAGKWINGVIAGLSVHLQRGRIGAPNANDLDSLYVDIGARSAAEARAAGVAILSPVMLDCRLYSLQDGKLTGAGIADRYGPAALVEILRHLDPSKLSRPLVVAFVVQNERGLEYAMQSTPGAETSYVGGRPLPRSVQGVTALQAPVSWAGTPAETVDGNDVTAIIARLETSLGETPTDAVLPDPDLLPEPPLPDKPQASPTPEQILRGLVPQYGVDPDEARVRQAIEALLPPWAHPTVDSAGNLILHWGDAAARAPRLLFVAHQDEIGFLVDSILPDGKLALRSRGGGDLDFYLGHPILVHTQAGMRPGVLELPPNWQQRGFRMAGQRPALRADIGTKSAAETEALGVGAGDMVTIPKRYRKLLGDRATARAFDDRVGDSALIAATWALGPSLPGRDITFAWSTGEEIGLVGAGALAQQLATAERTPNYVFAVDTFVSSDSPLESQRYADTPLGAGFVIRAIDNSSLMPWPLARRLQRMARAANVPVQMGITGGGNDGSVFTRYGSVDLPLGWPLRYSHSPGEVIATRDLDSLARMLATLAHNW